jgi:cytochrome c peroxidase
MASYGGPYHASDRLDDKRKKGSLAAAPEEAPMAAASGRNTLTYVRAIAAVVVVFAGSGCAGESAFTEDEMRRLEGFRLTAPPRDPTNRWAEDIEAAKLGKLFYFDTRFSGPLGPYNVPATNGSLGAAGEVAKVACASCHDPAYGGTDHRSVPNATSLGVSYTGRNASSVINAAYSLWQFWDGHKDSLWSQALAPPEGEAEDNGSRLAVVHLLAERYRDRYTAVFGPMQDMSDRARFPAAGKPGEPAYDGMTPEDRRTVNQIYANFGKAIAAYERRLVSPNFRPSAFDRFMAGDPHALEPAAIRGARLFIGRAGCVECHMGPMFTDFDFHNVGTPQQGQYVPRVDEGRLEGIDLVKTDPFNRAGAFSDAVSSAHLEPLVLRANMSETQRRAVTGLFKTPTLRNVSRTAPYMHDGVYGNLREVVSHYNFGGGTGAYSGDKDLAISPLLLSSDEVDDLVAFLRALEDGPPLPTAHFPEGLTGPPPALP